MKDSRLSYAVNFAIIFLGLVAYIFVLNFLVVHVDWSWLQNAEASAVYAIQTGAGIGASYNSTEMTIAYANPEFSMQIIAMCTGISELLFFAFLVLLIRGPGFRTKAVGLVVFLPLIFAINIIRLLALHPLAVWLGVQGMWEVHWLIWKYGMFVVLMILFAVWYLVFARKELQPQKRQ